MQSRIKIISNSVLIAEFNDCQLRQENNIFWMLSPKTGIHSITANTLDNRVLIHWDGFKINQSRN
jgi:hypothetical protein